MEKQAKKDTAAESLALHEEYRGKVEVKVKVPLKTLQDLALVDAPGVAAPCLSIVKDKDNIYKYTNRGNVVAVLSDGTSVLGLGDIGPDAGLPVMEGKCVLFKSFANIDAIPIMVASKNIEEIIQAAKLIAPSLGGINLEDIAAPKCFEIERRLRNELDIPVMHDDQHGTAIVAAAGLSNALKLVNKTWADLKVVCCGAGAAGTAIIKLLLLKGVTNIVATDRCGAIYAGRSEHMNPAKEELAALTNPNHEVGQLADVIKGADVFVGVSGPNLLKKEWVKDMKTKPIIFALANPIPEIMPPEAKEGGAYIVATGRSDFPNQINNCLAFPGVFRGALDVRARDINDAMKLAAVEALANLVKRPSIDNIIPSAFTPDLAFVLGDAVAKAAIETGMARVVPAKYSHLKS
jgi:malate dehydrogenase (oxaloacetate-decarboxylating)